MRGYFFVFRRTLPSGNKIYYFQAYGPDGTLSNARSTGQTRKAAAVHYCETLLKEGKIWTGANTKFKQYAEHFFDRDSLWVMDRMATGTPDHPALSETYLEKLQMTVRTHLMPFFENFRLSQITPSNVKQYRLYMLQERKLSYKTVNDACAVLKMITDNAILDNMIVNSPLRGIKPLMKNPSPREAFTTEDARKVLAFPWKEEGWRFFSFFAALTGMRLAEIHAVRRENVKDTYIDLQDQYLNGKLRPLKTKTSRKVPLCKELHDIIEKRIRESPNGYAFYDVAETMASKKLSEYLAKYMPERKKDIASIAGVTSSIHTYSQRMYPQ